MMSLVLTLALFGAVIGLNNLALALTMGGLGGRKHMPRILLVFAVFEFSVPLLGVVLGQHAAQALAQHSAWLGPLLLAGLGIATLIAAARSRVDREKLAQAMTGWRGLIALSAGLSTDNLVVGFGLGLGGIPPLALAGTIMVCSVGFAFVGLQVGHLVQRDFQRPALVLAGLVLIGLAGADWAGWM